MKVLGRHLGAAVMSMVVLCATSALAADSPWVGTWGTSSASQFVNAFVDPGTPTAAAAGLKDQTVRQVVPTTLAGSSLRLRFSNLKGDRMLRVQNVHVGLQDTEAAVKKGTNRPVTFSGATHVLIPAGSFVLSDALAMPLAINQELAVSFFVAGPSGRVTTGESGAVSYLADGNIAGQEDGATFKKAGNAKWLMGVDVTPASSVGGSVIVLGDSLTAGGRRSWPGALWTRVSTESKTPTLSVMNFAIAGVRLLRDSTCFGESAIGRFDEVLAQPNVKAVIVALGGNDIRIADLTPGEPTPTALKYPNVVGPCWFDRTAVSAADLVSGLSQLALRAHERGIKIYWTPITPYTSTAAERAVLTATNDAVKKSKVFDGIFDTATPCTDRADPWKLSAACDVGDNMHFSPGGAIIFASGIDLAVLRKVVQ